MVTQGAWSLGCVVESETREAVRLAHTQLTSALCLALYVTATGTPLDRDRAPVFIGHDELSTLLGSPAHEIVAFSCQEGWNPIPVQIDELPVGIPTLACADVTRYTSPDDDVDLVDYAEFMGKFVNQ